MGHEQGDIDIAGEPLVFRSVGAEQINPLGGRIMRPGNGDNYGLAACLPADRPLERNATR